MPDPVDVLALAAHPDDAEAGCGGSLVIAARAGMRTAIADLTAGELSTHGTPERRASERDAASAELGLAERVGAGLPDGALDGGADAHRRAVVAIYRALRPRIVLAPYWDDRHPDHAAAGRLARDAAFLAGVRRYGEGEPYRPEHVFHYMLHHPFVPSFVVDVTAVWEVRCHALRAYHSQFARPEGDQATAIAGHAFLDMLDARAVTHGAMVGVDRGEAFLAPGPVGLTRLPGLRGERPVHVHYTSYL